ncbi:ankyrin repeat protein, putative [Trichomonas vaginalis G3]|uniref:Ankyrin repeat protein, putative n=1 Tax=Trichomonas vaginalis (strain ATCC PRA-98 / G3) TaxID=412133 RepID=A2FI09_TRIV3|nr:cyclin-dependent kinase inhibitor 2C-related family [Trichomonas vaginalis G3]EAX95437.1 ankyrin repeat protein, putative [Trichomonas vaginalis G3]KAI5542886.1 cyclin-dependent kinase inhibitor 2C-related family [Trichomonas vaginalis G3]|eukprot:XP_001308367.1 ankyrin repeat protein [Trichomonas vaginalis G3]
MSNSKANSNAPILHGFNINEKNNDGDTALHIATKYNNKEFVELLISYGAYVNEKNNRGKTSLEIAKRNNCEGIVKLLVSHGAK